MDFKTIISCLLIVVCIGITNATQYILSFTDYNAFMMIDIGTGDLVFNQTMNRYYQVSYIESVNFETSTVSFFCTYNTMKGGDYVLVNYHWDTNSFSNKSKPIEVNHVQFEYYDNQSFEMVNNQICVTTFAVTNLTIACFDFDAYTFESISYNVPDYNQSVASLGTYDPISNKYYSLYYTNELNANFVSVNVPLVTGEESGIEVTSFPKNSGKSNGLTFSVGLGNLLVTPSGQLYYIERFEFNITVYEINLSTVQATIVFTIPMVYNWFYEEHYASADNKYLIFMVGPTTDSPNTPITYSFVDTQTWKSVYSFTSPNYFQAAADTHDYMFYFGGSF